MKTTLILFGLLGISLAGNATGGEKIDVSKGFNGVEWGMSLEAVEKAVTGAERNTAEELNHSIPYTASLKLNGDDPVFATYFLFLGNQMTAVVRIFKVKILEETTPEAICQALSEQFVQSEGIVIGFQNHNIWNFFPLGNSGPVVLPRKGSRTKVLPSSPPAARLVILNERLQAEIREKMSQKKLEQDRIAAEKLVPILVNP